MPVTTTLELAYQLRDHAEILAGSEDLAPGEGRPHATILDEWSRGRQ